jgi:hypothetical protein
MRLLSTDSPAMASKQKLSHGQEHSSEPDDKRQGLPYACVSNADLPEVTGIAADSS